MEKTTGELSLTVVTIAAIVLISAFVGTMLWPRISKWINSSFDTMGVPAGTGYLEVINEEVNM